MTTGMRVLATPATVDDGYIKGTIVSRPRKCERCHISTRCIYIHAVVLPQGVTLRATILQDRSEEDPHAIQYLGIGCGCYGKFHRQLVHITG